MDKSDARWGEGISRQVKAEPAAVICHDEGGDDNSEELQRRAEHKKLNLQQMEQQRGLPWELVPGAGRSRSKSRTEIR